MCESRNDLYTTVQYPQKPRFSAVIREPSRRMLIQSKCSWVHSHSTPRIPTCKPGYYAAWSPWESRFSINLSRIGGTDSSVARIVSRYIWAKLARTVRRFAGCLRWCRSLAQVSLSSQNCLLHRCARRWLQRCSWGLDRRRLVHPN